MFMLRLKQYVVIIVMAWYDENFFLELCIVHAISRSCRIVKFKLSKGAFFQKYVDFNTKLRMVCQEECFQ